MNTIAKARKRGRYVYECLETLPLDVEGVGTVTEGFKTVIDRIDTYEKVLTPLHKKLNDLINIANYPDFSSDSMKIRNLSSMYADTNFNPNDADRVISLIQEIDAASREHKQFAGRYVVLMQQQTEEGNNCKESLKAL